MLNPRRKIQALPENRWRRWWVVVLFAIAMAWVESAAVVYLRTVVGRIEPHQTKPLPVSDALSRAELVREAATLIMLFAVGWLAGQTWRSRLGYSLIAFGLWDIFYYLFLKLICGWPHSLLDWDVLFLLPLPWWGPVLAPTLIAALMVLGGTLLSQFDRVDQPLWPSRRSVALNLGGVALALYVFMADAIHVMGGGREAVRNVLPAWFNWPLFLCAFLMMSAPVWRMAARIWKRRQADSLSNAPANCGG